MSAHILVIDDEKSICEGCRLILSEHGFDVDSHTLARSGLDALQHLDFDVLLLDMKLPDIDGMQVLLQVRRSHPHVQVIVMSGYSSVPNAVEAMKQGAFDYLSKPFSDDELALVVTKAVENKRLREENTALRKQLFERFDFDNIIGENPAILKIFEQTVKVAPTDSTVLLEGESGTGKELFAKTIHAHSHRAGKQFLAVDCSTIATTLLESELFGHVKGAFTGAVENKPGIFEAARGGTLFLDEVANLNWQIQGKLLRVMDTHEYKPVGSAKVRLADVRIIAATNRDLRAMLENGDFRDDLFYRLSVFPIRLPPLRERRDDIPRLAYHFLRAFCREAGKRIDGFSNDALELLVQYPWPGNVRQLKNVIERLVILADEPFLNEICVSEQLQTRKEGKPAKVPETLQELHAYKKNWLENQFRWTERAFLIQALKAEAGSITRAAQRVGMQRSNFSAMMKKHGITSEPSK